MVAAGFTFLKFALAFACVLILPGVLLFHLLFDRGEHDTVEIIPVGMVFSIAMLSVAGIVLYLIGLNVNALMALLPALLLVLVILNIAKRRRNGHAPSKNGKERGGARTDSPNGGKAVTLGIWILLLCAAALMLYRGGMSLWSSDTYDHVGTIREIVEKREIMPGDAFYGGEQRLGPDPRKGLLHTCFAMISIITGIEPFQIWLWLPVFLLPILLCGYMAFTGALFKSRKIALLSSVLFVLCFGGLDRSNLRMVGFPLFAAFQFYLIALFFMFRYLENGRARFLFAGASIGCMIAVVHIYYFFQFILAVAAFFVFSCLFRREDRRSMVAIAKLGLITLAFSVPLLVMRYRFSYAIANPFDLQPRHLLFITEKIYISNPLEVWKVLGPIGLLAFGATPFLFKRAKADAGILFLFSAMVTTPLILLNPLAVEILGRVMTYGLVRRIALYAPYIAVTGYCVYQAACSLRGGMLVRRDNLKALAFLSLFVVMLIPYAKGFVGEYSPASVEFERKHSYLPWRDALTFMQEQIVEPSVILSDPVTSFSIPAFTRHNIVAVLIGHSSPLDAENIDRVAAADDVLNPYVDMKATIALLNRYHVQYIIVNQTFASSLYESYWSVDVKEYEATRRKFETHPGLFENVYERDRIYIYEYHPEEVMSESEIAESPSRPFVLENESRLPEVVNAAFSDGLLLIGASVEKKTVRRGENLELKCYWKCSEVDTALKDYRVFARFDTAYRKGALYSRHFSKIYRIILQTMTGSRYRFRSEHSPVNGVYPPRLWRKGEIIEDRFETMVPSDVSKGRYDIRINLLSLPFSPNYSLKDLFSDEDVYAGVRVGSIIVE
ncbi:MAG: hypothetical protein NTW97_03055 [Candidatus Krumholzibacteria bacterium]|nr:hypothetical protein [Candidatus Krumholzibacteria bacterium]